MTARHFHVWEGGGEIHDIYVDSHLLKGMDLLKSGNYKEAVKEFETADLYPENLEVGRPETGRHSAKGYYYLGKAYQALGNKKKAKESFDIAANSQVRRRRMELASENTLFNALAMNEAGRQAESKELLQKLSTEIEEQLAGRVTVDAYSKFGEDGSRDERIANLNYLKGLLECYKGNDATGKVLLQKAVDMSPNLIWAKQFLNHTCYRICERLENESRKKTFIFLLLDFYFIFSNQGNLSSGASTSIVFGPRNFLPVSSRHSPLGSIT